MQRTVCETSFTIEMLSIEQFAERMAVGRTTVYEWIKSGYLVAGRHYVRLGSTVRFAWGNDLLKKLLEDSAEEETKHQVLKEEPPVCIQSTPVGRQKGLQINLNY